MLNKEDQQIAWSQLLKGDSAAFDNIMRLYFNPLAVYGWRFTRDKQLIKDVIQELFLFIWQKRDRLSNHVNLQSYIYASFRRLLIRKIKEQEKSKIILIEDVTLEDFQLSVSISRELIEKEQAIIWENQLNQCIQELPARQREVIYLRFFQGLSREEVAQVLAITTQTVSNIQQMAIRTLRETIPGFSKKFLILLIINNLSI